MMGPKRTSSPPQSSRAKIQRYSDESSSAVPTIILSNSSNDENTNDFEPPVKNRAVEGGPNIQVLNRTNPRYVVKSSGTTGFRTLQTNAMPAFNAQSSFGQNATGRIGIKVEVPDEDMQYGNNVPATSAANAVRPSPANGSSAVTPAGAATLDMTDFIEVVAKHPLLWDTKGNSGNAKKIAAWHDIMEDLREKKNYCGTVEEAKQVWKRVTKGFHVSLTQIKNGRKASFKHFDECMFLLSREAADVQKMVLSATGRGEQGTQLVSIPSTVRECTSPVRSPEAGFSLDVRETRSSDWLEIMLLQTHHPEETEETAAESIADDQPAISPVALNDQPATSPVALNSTEHEEMDCFHHFGMFVAGYLRQMPIEQTKRIITEITGTMMMS